MSFIEDRFRCFVVGARFSVAMESARQEAEKGHVNEAGTWLEEAKTLLREQNCPSTEEQGLLLTRLENLLKAAGEGQIEAIKAGSFEILRGIEEKILPSGPQKPPAPMVPVTPLPTAPPTILARLKELTAEEGVSQFVYLAWRALNGDEKAHRLLGEFTLPTEELPQGFTVARFALDAVDTIRTQDPQQPRALVPPVMTLFHPVYWGWLLRQGGPGAKDAREALDAAKDVKVVQFILSDLQAPP